jgi:hypothetical protein
MSDFTFNGVSYTEDEVKGAASGLGLSLDDYLTQNSDVQKVEPIDPGTEKTGGEGQSTFAGKVLELTADWLGMASEAVAKSPTLGPISGFLGMLVDGDAISRGLKGNNIDLIEATNNLKNAEEITPELLDAFVTEAKESNKNAEKLTELQGFVESFDKEMEDSGNPLMATWSGIKNAGGLGAFQSVMAQSIAGLLSPSAMRYGAGAAGPGALIGSKVPIIGTIAGGFGAYSAFANAHVENMVTFSSAVQEELQFRNMDFTSNNVRKLFQDKDAIRRMELTALKRGATIGAIEGLGSLAAIRGGSAVNKALRASGKSKAIGALGGTATAAGVEMAAGGLGEAAGLTVEGKPLEASEIVLEAISGPFSSAPITIAPQAINILKKPTYKINGQLVKESSIRDIIEKSSPEELAGIDFEIQNDSYLNNLKNDKQLEADILGDIKSRVADKADQQKIVELEKQRLQYKDSKTKSAQNFRSKIDEQIKEITDKYAQVGRKNKETLEFEAQQQRIKDAKQTRNVAATSRFLEQEAGKFGLESMVLENTSEVVEALKYAGATEEQINEFLEDSKKNSIGGGVFNNIAYINKEQAAATDQIDVGSHELLHGILNNVVGDIESQQKLVNNFKKTLTNKQQKTVQDFLNENYDKEEHDAEYLTAFSDLVRSDKIKFNQGIFNKINNVLANVFQGKLGIGKAGFGSGRQTYNFLREYNKGIEKGQISENISNLYTPEQQTSAFSKANSQKSIPEKSLSELTKDYQTNPAEADIESLLTQYYSTGIDALVRWGASAGRNVPVRDVLKDENKRNEVQSLLNAQFNSFIKNFKGDLSEATTYMNNIARRVGPAMMEFIEESKVGRLEDSQKEVGSKIDPESQIDEVVPTIDPVIDLILEGRDLNINELEQAYLDNLDKVDLTNYKTASDASPETTQKIFGETEEQELKTFKEKDETIYNLFPENQRRNVKGTTKSATGLKPSIRNNFYVKGERADMVAGTTAGNPIQAKIPFDKFIPALEKFDSKDHGKSIKQKFGELSGTVGPKNRNQKTFRQAVKAEIGKAITLYVARKNEINEDIVKDIADGKSPMSYSRRPKPGLFDNLDEAFYNDENKISGKEIAENYDSWKKTKTEWYELGDKGSGMKYANGIKTIIEILVNAGLWPKGFIKKSQITGQSRMFGTANRKEYDTAMKELDFLTKETDRSFLANRADQKFGTTGKEAKRKATGKAVDEFNINNAANFITFWKGILYILRNNPELAPTVFHMLDHSSNIRSHYHALGAKLLYVNFKAKNLTWEHALQNKNAFKYLFAKALDPKTDFDVALKTLMDNYVLIGLDKVNDDKLSNPAVNLKNKMSAEGDIWNISRDFWWQRYFNYIVAQIDGGIDPNNLINPVTGKSLAKELNVDVNGDPINETLYQQEVKAAQSNGRRIRQRMISYSKRKQNDHISKAKELDAEVEALQNKFYSGKNLEKEFNDIVAMKTGIKSEARFKAAAAQIRGEKKGKGLLNMLIPPRTQDFMGLMYNVIGAGQFGNAQMKWFEDNFSRPYAKAMNDFSIARVALMDDFKALKNSLGIIPKNLKELVPGTIYTQEHAVRVYTWTKQGFEIPDISKKDHRALLKFVKNNPQLEIFSNKLVEIQKGDGYVKPDESWMAGGIVPDLLENLNKTTRKKYLKQWQENVDKVFTKETLNKLEAAFGKPYRAALEGALRRMSDGINRRQNRDPYIGKFVDWLNGSIGVIMFFNTRSAILQTISMANFINHTDNNIFAAAKAFGNQKQYWSDFMMLFNSDFLRDRRGGLRINVNEADIAEMAKKQGARGVIHKILQFGFIPTQIADSFAIASGGAAFYRNRLNAYIKDGMSSKEAADQAYQDFRENAEESQQSSRPDKISQEQAGDLGRLILAFGNTPGQYFRIKNKQYRDIKNKRRIPGLTLPQSQIARAQVILYYLVVQNIIFNAMQQALFALGFEDEDDEKLIQDKAIATANGMLDSVLRGMGMVGAGISTIKNAGLKIHGELGKSRPNYEKAVDELLNVSPPIDSKITRLKQAARTFQWQQKAIKNKGVSIDNPALMAAMQIIAATTNVPMDRLLRKVDNVTTAFEQDLDLWQRLALLGGWSDWQIGIEDESEYAKTKYSKSKIKKKKIKKNPRIKLK